MVLPPTAIDSISSLQTRELVAKLEAGIIRETSIGFTFGLPECSVCRADMRTCPHEPGRDGAFYWLRDVQAVIEGSLVPAGSQGTQVVAQLRCTPDCANTGGDCKCTKRIEASDAEKAAEAYRIARQKLELELESINTSIRKPPQNIRG